MNNNVFRRTATVSKPAVSRPVKAMPTVKPVKVSRPVKAMPVVSKPKPTIFKRKGV